MNPPTLPGFVWYIDIQKGMDWPLDKGMCCTKTKFESKLSHKQ